VRRAARTHTPALNISAGWHRDTKGITTAHAVAPTGRRIVRGDGVTRDAAAPAVPGSGAARGTVRHRPAHRPVPGRGVFAVAGWVEPLPDARRAEQPVGLDNHRTARKVVPMSTEALIAKVRFDSRVAQLVGEMITEGWDRKTATAIAREFAKAGA